MENPNIQGEEYQHGTLQGWQLRAYIFDQNGCQCFYCGERGKRMTLDHVIPTSRGGNNRVTNLTAACRKCNQQKDNRLPEEFLADNPEKLQQLLIQNPRRSYRNAGWMNTMMTFLLEGLAGLGLPLEQTNGAQTSWNRQQMQLAKNHPGDAAILGNCQSLSGMPRLIARITPDNGRRKQKAHVDEHGTPRGKPFREYCRLGPRERSRRPTPGHAGKRTHFGPQLLTTGDIVTIQHKKLGSDNRPGRDDQPGDGREGPGGKRHFLRPNRHRQAGPAEPRVHQDDGNRNGKPTVDFPNTGAEFCNRLNWGQRTEAPRHGKIN